MDSEEVGSIHFCFNNVILWTIPSVKLLDQKKDIGIWSPPFLYSDYCCCNSFSFSRRLETIKNDFFTLIVNIPDAYEPPMQSVEFGLAGKININNLNNPLPSFGEWYEACRNFKVLNFVSRDFFKDNYDLTWPCLEPYYRIFCNVIDERKCDAVNTSTNDGKMYQSANAAVEAVKNKERENHIYKQCCNKSHRNLEKLSQDFKDLYIQRQDTDIVLVVKDQEFKAHKGVLRSRSPVFNAMFTHELSESNSGLVPIQDCEPVVFEEFLLFVYSGSTQHLSSDNVCEMYYIADKYELLELKEICVDFLKKSLSIEMICDVICLSTKHNEMELLDLATTFFARNMEEILLTVKWQLFMKENSTEANELIIKALKLGFTKKNC